MIEKRKLVRPGLTGLLSFNTSAPSSCLSDIKLISYWYLPRDKNAADGVISCPLTFHSTSGHIAPQCSSTAFSHLKPALPYLSGIELQRLCCGLSHWNSLKQPQMHKECFPNSQFKVELKENHKIRNKKATTGAHNR